MFEDRKPSPLQRSSAVFGRNEGTGIAPNVEYSALQFCVHWWQVSADAVITPRNDLTWKLSGSVKSPLSTGGVVVSFTDLHSVWTKAPQMALNIFELGLLVAWAFGSTGQVPM